VRIAVVGAGAIGGYLGARLALSGRDVTFVARGANLSAIATNGFRLIDEDGEEHVAHPNVVSSAAEAGPHDLVLLAVKAHQVSALAPEMPVLLGPDTSVVTLQNGIPWWFFYRFGGPHEGRIVHAADPEGSIARHIPNERIVGSVVYPASELIAPGVVKVIEGNRFTLGEPDGTRSARIEAVSVALTAAGFKAPVSIDLRSEIWLKLWGNMVFNPVSALTHATLDRICAFAPTRTLAERTMAEAADVAEALGLRLRVSVEKRIAGAAAVGAHKTSMLQDVEAGRPIELDALVGSVVELARLTGVATPSIDAVYACTALLSDRLAESGAALRL
jgi:2-dehydropantoate 2-reductase